MKTLRLATVSAALLIALAGCSTAAPGGNTNAAGGAGSPSATPSATPTIVPSPISTVKPNVAAPAAKVKFKCDNKAVVKAVTKAGYTIKNAISYNHTPTPGSPLALARDKKATTCAWSTETGFLSVWWTTVDATTWDAVQKAIVNDGGAVTTIPGVSADVSYFTFTPRPSGGSMAFGTLDALHGKTWIRILNSTWTTADETVKTYQAAVAIAKLRG